MQLGMSLPYYFTIRYSAASLTDIKFLIVSSSCAFLLRNRMVHCRCYKSLSLVLLLSKFVLDLRPIRYPYAIFMCL